MNFAISPRDILAIPLILLVNLASTLGDTGKTHDTFDLQPNLCLACLVDILCAIFKQKSAT